MRPVHKIKPSRSIIAYTWCGVEPYRRGSRRRTSTTKLRRPARPAWPRKPRRRRPPRSDTRSRLPKSGSVSKDYDTLVRLIETSDLNTVLSDVRTYLYRKIDGTDPAVGHNLRGPSGRHPQGAGDHGCQESHRLER